MEKNDIKLKLRETLEAIFEKEAKKEKDTDKKDDETESSISSEYTEIKTNLDKLGAPPQAHIMQMAGLGKVGDKTAEAKFSHKLNKKQVPGQKKGVHWEFNKDERAAILKALNRAKK